MHLSFYWLAIKHTYKQIFTLALTLSSHSCSCSCSCSWNSNKRWRWQKKKKEKETEGLKWIYLIRYDLFTIKNTWDEFSHFPKIQVFALVKLLLVLLVGCLLAFNIRENRIFFGNNRSSSALQMKIRFLWLKFSSEQ